MLAATASPQRAPALELALAKTQLAGGAMRENPLYSAKLAAAAASAASAASAARGAREESVADDPLALRPSGYEAGGGTARPALRDMFGEATTADEALRLSLARVTAAAAGSSFLGGSEAAGMRHPLAAPLAFDNPLLAAARLRAGAGAAAAAPTPAGDAAFSPLGARGRGLPVSTMEPREGESADPAARERRRFWAALGGLDAPVGALPAAQPA
jgi:hypothetical protein